MAVYTPVSKDQASALLHALGLGELTELQACTGGIENTNYFVSARHNGQLHHYVLTLFERLTLAQLPFYLHLMKHLAERGIAVPRPYANAAGELVFIVQGKPAAVVDRLPGKSELHPTPAHCAQVGAALAQMHLAGRDFAPSQPHLRGLAWWNERVPELLPFLNAAQQALMQRELAYQNELAAGSTCAALPRGPIHADLFRDNVLFDTGAGTPVLSGLFDFYFAGVDAWLFDLAVCLNDWCIDPQSHGHQAALAAAFMAAYHAVRPLQAAERTLLPAMLRAAALRFWISRVWDFYLPRQASLLQPHDPAHFEQVLTLRATRPMTFETLMESV